MFDRLRDAKSCGNQEKRAKVRAQLQKEMVETHMKNIKQYIREVFRKKFIVNKSSKPDKTPKKSPSTVSAPSKERENQ